MTSFSKEGALVIYEGNSFDREQLANKLRTLLWPSFHVTSVEDKLAQRQRHAHNVEHHRSSHLSHRRLRFTPRRQC